MVLCGFVACTEAVAAQPRQKNALWYNSNIFVVSVFWGKVACSAATRKCAHKQRFFFCHKSIFVRQAFVKKEVRNKNECKYYNYPNFIFISSCCSLSCRWSPAQSWQVTARARGILEEIADEELRTSLVENPPEVKLGRNIFPRRSVSTLYLQRLNYLRLTLLGRKTDHCKGRDPNFWIFARQTNFGARAFGEHSDEPKFEKEFFTSCSVEQRNSGGARGGRRWAYTTISTEYLLPLYFAAEPQKSIFCRGMIFVQNELRPQQNTYWICSDTNLTTNSV